MPTWLMKTGDDTYREWSTIVDDWVSDPMNRDEAIEASTLPPDYDPLLAEDRLRFVDEHLCSCRARFGERTEIRGGRIVTTGGGELAYHFSDYDEVAQFCRTQEQMADDDDF